MILATVALIIAGFTLPLWVRYNQEKAAIVEIEKLGGSAEIEYRGPAWLRGWIDKKYLAAFYRAVNVWIGTSDSGLPVSKIDDAGLKHLIGLTNLRHLGLRSTHVSDAGRGHLSGLKSLHGLILDETMVTDAGLMHLVSAPNLEDVDFLFTQVTQAGADKLQRAAPSLNIGCFNSKSGGMKSDRDHNQVRLLRTMAMNNPRRVKIFTRNLTELSCPSGKRA